LSKGDSGGPLVVQSKKYLFIFKIKSKNNNFFNKETDGRWYLGGITSFGKGNLIKLID
jgi:hypothetical protein